MSVRTLQIGDLHICPKNLSTCEKIIEKVKEVAMTYEFDFIVVLGDILDNHNIVENESFNMAYDLIDALRKEAPVYVIIGNHDISNPNAYLTNKHFFTPLEEFENVTVVDRVKVENYQGLEMIFCPYVPAEKFISILDEANDLTEEGWKHSSCVFSHVDIRGASYEKDGVTSNDGVVWKDSYPFYIGGHHHRPHQPRSNIYLPGSCIATSSNDESRKSISIVTFYSESDESSMTEVLRWKYKQIPLGVKTKKTFHIPDIKNINFSEIERLSEVYDLKVCYQGHPSDTKEFERSEIYEHIKKICSDLTLIKPRKTLLEKPIIPKNSGSSSSSNRTFMDIFEEVVNTKSEHAKEAFGILKSELVI